MAVRLYAGYGTAAYIPASWKGAWNDTSAGVTAPIAVTPENTPTSGGSVPLSVSKAETSLTNPYLVALIRLISAPLDSNQAISGILSVLCNCIESNSSANMFMHMHAWVTEGDSDTVRGTLVTNATDVTEISSLGNVEKFATAISSVNALSGDRIVIELGYSAANASATSYTGTMYYGSSDTRSDVEENDLGYGGGIGLFNNQFVELDTTPTFVISNSRISQIAIETLLFPTINDIRFSQVAVEVPIIVIPPIRFSQVVVEVIIGQSLALSPINPLPIRCQAKYWANLYDTNGTLVAVFDDFKPVTIEHKINAFSNCTFSIDGLDPRIALFKLDYILEVWRDIGDYSYIEFEGFHRSDQLQYTEGGHWVYTSYSRGFEDLLVRRCLLYKADKYVNKYRLKQAPAETVLKEYVNENAGPAANNLFNLNTNPTGRVVLGATSNFSIEADQARGPIYTANYIWRNLYEILREIAQGSGTDFSVARHSGNQFEFRCYYPTRGADKTSTLIFSPEYGNMVMPSYTLSRTEEVNVAIILGRGEGVSRWIYTGVNNTIYDSPWNRRETTHDARNGSDLMNEYIDTATGVLNNLKAKEAFEFKVMQTDASSYGLDYVLGDICTVKFGAISKAKKIIGVTLNLRDGTEDINIEFSDYPTI